MYKRLSVYSRCSIALMWNPIHSGLDNFICTFSIFGTAWISVPSLVIKTGGNSSTKLIESNIGLSTISLDVSRYKVLHLNILVSDPCKIPLLFYIIDW